MPMEERQTAQLKLRESLVVRQAEIVRLSVPIPLHGVAHRLPRLIPFNP